MTNRPPVVVISRAAQHLPQPPLSTRTRKHCCSAPGRRATSGRSRCELTEEVFFSEVPAEPALPARSRMPVYPADTSPPTEPTSTNWAASARPPPRVFVDLCGGSVGRDGKPWAQLAVFDVRGHPVMPLFATHVGGLFVAQHLRCGDGGPDSHRIVIAGAGQQV